MTEPLPTPRPDKPSPFCLRLSLQERQWLEQAAGGMPLGEYIRQRLFGEGRLKRKTRVRVPIKDHRMLSQLLGELGRSRLPSNLNQLAKAVHTGTLVLSPEVEALLMESCADVRSMRANLMQALGLEG
jgi:hypothetical protein